MLFATWILRSGRREAFVPEVFLSCTHPQGPRAWLQGMMGGDGRDNKCVWPYNCHGRWDGNRVKRGGGSSGFQGFR